MVKKRNGAIDFWRFVFAAVLVVYHSCMLEINLIHPDEEAILPFPLGPLAVEFFLLTSGFLFAKSMNRQSGGFSWQGTWRFMKAKLLSFYPAYLICLVLTFIAVNVTKIACRIEPFSDGVSLTEKVRSLFVNGVKLLYEASLLRNFGLDFERLLDQAWYLSAMLLVMLLLYPLYAKNKRRFEYYIAPAIAIFLLGFLYLHGQSLLNPSKKLELFYKYTFTYKGNVRAMAEICLGVVCYRVCEWMKKLDFTLLGRALLTAVELFGYGLTLFFMQTAAVRNYNVFWRDLSRAAAPAMGEGFEPVPLQWSTQFTATEFTVLLFLAASVIVTFSEKSLLIPLFRHRIFSVLGRYSLYPYLLYSMFAPNLTYWLRELHLSWLPTGTIVLIYCVLTFVTAAIVMALHTAVSNRLKQRKAQKSAGEGQHE